MMLGLPFPELFLLSHLLAIVGAHLLINAFNQLLSVHPTKEATLTKSRDAERRNPIAANAATTTRAMPYSKMQQYGTQVFQRRTTITKPKKFEDACHVYETIIGDTLHLTTRLADTRAR